LLFCLMSNLLSIFGPMPLAVGSLKPIRPRFVPVLLQLLFVFLLPLALAPTLLPYGIEFLLESFGWAHGIPICLLLSLVECAAFVSGYHAAVTWQGHLLKARELKILEVVTAKAE